MTLNASIFGVAVHSQTEIDADGVTHQTLGVIDCGGNLLCQVEDNAAGMAHINANYTVVCDWTDDGRYSDGRGAGSDPDSDEGDGWGRNV